MSSDDLRGYPKALQTRIRQAVGDNDLFQTIVDGPFTNKLLATQLDLGIVVFLQVNHRSGTIDRIALSNTELAKSTLNITDIPFKEIKIPLSDKNNILSIAVRTGRPQHTVDWEYLFTPVLPGESARFNQAAGGIGCSYVYPLKSRDGGALIFSYFQPIEGITRAHTTFMREYAKVVDSAL